MQVQHERGLHFAGVAHAAHLGLAHLPDGRIRERPIGRKHDARFRMGALQLAKGRLHGDLVAAVTVQQEYLSAPRFTMLPHNSMISWI